MALPPGTFVGPYEIVGLLGAGSMGEVYRVRDAQLNREIALKILPTAVSKDPHAVGRFRREAETASALNHPHIVHIYGIGEAGLPQGQTRYIAMELVAGGTLRARLQMGDRHAQLLAPLAQVCDALATAHKANIVHRDLKPANIMITVDGYAKVVDFGLAKLVERGGDAATLAAEDRFTETGKVVGTIGYMSPEQARGESLDSRSDIFAIGCILYEILCGRPPFVSSSTVATLHAIAYDDPPPITAFNEDAPEALCAIAAKCLEKDPNRRYQSAGEVAHHLRAFAAPSSKANPFAPTQTQTATAVSTVGRRRAVTGIAVVAVILVAIGVAGRLSLDRAAPSAPPAAPGIRLEKLTSRGNAANPAISPDGRYLVYSSAIGTRRSLWLRDLVEKTETILVDPGDAVFVRPVRFSNDGQSVYYAVSNARSSALYKVPLIGGDARLVRSTDITFFSPDEQHFAFRGVRDGKGYLVVAGGEGSEEREVAEIGRGGVLAWSPDGRRVLFSRDRVYSDAGVYLPADDARGEYRLFVVNHDGTGEQQVGVVDQPPEGRAWWSPDGGSIVLTPHKNQRDIRLVSVDLATGKSQQLGEKLWPRRELDIDALFWLDSRRLLIAAGNQLWRCTYPEGVIEKVPLGTHQYRSFAVSSDRTRLVGVEGGVRSDLMISGDPEAQAFQAVTGGTDVTLSFGWTPDGRLVLSSNDAGSYDLYVMNRDGSNRKALTFDRLKNETQPAPSPDGKYIVFASDSSGDNALYRINADGTGLLRLTSPSPGRGDRGPAITPDSKWVLYWHWDNGPRFFKLPIDGGTPVPVKTRTTAIQPGIEESAYGASASPDQRLLAFFYFTLGVSDRKFSNMTVAMSTPDGRILNQVPFRDYVGVGDHESVQWAADSRSVFYAVGDGLLSNLWRWPVGGTPSQFTHLEGRVLDFGWSTDGRHLAVVREQDTNDVVLITSVQ